MSAACVNAAVAAGAAFSKIEVTSSFLVCPTGGACMHFCDFDDNDCYRQVAYAYRFCRFCACCGPRAYGSWHGSMGLECLEVCDLCIL